MKAGKTTNPYTVVMTLPTALERTGDYSQSLNIAGGQRAIYDPYSTQYGGYIQDDYKLSLVSRSIWACAMSLRARRSIRRIATPATWI